jgi:hypothetical protein
MAAPTTTTGSKFILLFGDGATPEVFGAPCGLTERGLKFNKALNEFKVPDCSDPDAAVAILREVDTTDWSFSGSGLLALESRATYWAIYGATASRNMRFELRDRANVRIGYWAGKAHMSSLEFGANRGELITVSLELVADGAMPWVTG